MEVLVEVSCISLSCDPLLHRSPCFANGDLVSLISDYIIRQTVTHFINNSNNHNNKNDDDEGDDDGEGDGGG